MNKGFILRKIQKEDNKLIASLIRSVLAEFKANRPGTVYYDPTTDDLYALFQKQNSAYWVIVYDNEIVGGTGIYPTEGLPPGCCELVKLYLSADVRGKGWGRLLIEKCFEEAKQLGCTSMYLESMPELNTAVSLYERCGFKHLQGPMGNSGHFGCAIWMLKELN